MDVIAYDSGEQIGTLLAYSLRPTNAVVRGSEYLPDQAARGAHDSGSGQLDPPKPALKTEAKSHRRMPAEQQTMMIILMFGPNCVGKSSAARELAGRMNRAAYVETDLLKYLVAGGLVAWSAGLHPRKDPKEYRHQIALMTKNAALLACNFGAFGFDSVVEGLAFSEGPGSGWAEENLPGHDVRYVAVSCSPDVAIERAKERDGVIRDPTEYIEWQETVAHPTSGFDYVMDTSTLPIRDCVAACAAALQMEIAASPSAMGVEWDIVKAT